MKSSLRLLIACLLLACSGCTTLLPVPFTTDTESFAPGDSITIEHVSSSSTNFAIGDTVEVEGHYVLQSQSSAVLALYLSARSRQAAWTSDQPGQRQEVSAGEGHFRLRYQITGPGRLHVSFYPLGGGSVSGGIYFTPQGPGVSTPGK